MALASDVSPSRLKREQRFFEAQALALEKLPNLSASCKSRRARLSEQCENDIGPTLTSQQRLFDKVVCDTSTCYTEVACSRIIRSMLSKARDIHREPSVRDYLDVIARHWKVLVFVPITAGLAAFVYVNFASFSYRSEAIVSLSPEALVLVRSDKVLNVVAQETDLVNGSNGDGYEARRKLLSAIHTSLWQRDTNFYRLVVEQPTEQAAQEMLQKLIAALIAQSAPYGNTRLTLEKRRQTLERSLNDLDEALKHRKMINDRAVVSELSIAVPMLLATAGDSITGLTTAIEAKSQDLQGTELALKGIISQSNILSNPTPTGRTGPVALFVAATVTTVLGGLLVLFLLVWRAAGIELNESSPRRNSMRGASNAVLPAKEAR